MFRTDRLELLHAAPRRVGYFAAQLVLAPQAVEDDLRHRLMSANRGGDRVTVAPARCRHCGFTFHADKLHKPGRCPRCRQTWLSAPQYRIEDRSRHESR